jgi:hypothetical protein
MLPSKSQSIEAVLELILSNHFENCENPHETIYRIWLLLNVRSLPESSQAGTFDIAKRSELAGTDYN